MTDIQRGKTNTKTKIVCMQVFVSTNGSVLYTSERLRINMS